MLLLTVSKVITHEEYHHEATKLNNENENIGGEKKIYGKISAKYILYDVV